jgi:hypothetical protein
MSGLTVSGLREKTKRDLELARERVRTLEEQLKWIENAIAEDTGHSHNLSSSNDKVTEQQSLLAPVSSPGENTSGKAIRELMENAPGEFNVTGVVQAVAKDFPDIEHKVLSRKGSQIANRLATNKKIKMVKKGSGRKPHTYISVKYSGK